MSNLLSIHKSMLMINNKIVVEIILFESIIKIIFTYFVWIVMIFTMKLTMYIINNEKL